MEKCPLNCDNVKGGDDIWRNKMVYPAGKTPRKKTSKTRAIIMPILMSVLQHYCDVTTSQRDIIDII